MDAQREAQRACWLFQTNPVHPGLQFKKLEGEDDIYSARIGLGYRSLRPLGLTRCETIFPLGQRST